MSKVVIRFGADVARINQDSIARVLEAEARHTRGDDRDADAHVYFESYAQLHAALTPQRLDLFRYARRHPAQSIRALSEATGRDYRRVHDDVVALAELGFLERGESGVRALYDEVDIKLELAQA